MSTRARILDITVPARHAMHSHSGAAPSASRLLQVRLDELCADLGVAPLQAVLRDGTALTMVLDGQPLRCRIRVAPEPDTTFHPSLAAAQPVPTELVQAEVACRWLIGSLLAQRARWAPPAHDAARRDDALDTLPLPPPRVDLLLADRAELGEAESSEVAACHAVAQTLFSQLGLTLPTPRVRIDPALASGQFRVRVAGVRLPPMFGPLADEWMVYAPMAALQDKLPEWIAAARPFYQPWSGEVHTMMPASAALRERCDTLGLIHGGPLFYRLLMLAAEARVHAASLVNIDSVAFGLQGLARLEPALLQQARAIGLHALATVCRGLLEERVSMRDFARIVQSLVVHRGVALAGGGIDRVVFTHGDGGVITAPLEADDESPDQAQRLAAARHGLEAVFTQRYAPAGTQMRVFLPHAEVERALLTGLSQEQAAQLRRALKVHFDQLAVDATVPVLMTTTVVRRRLWDVVRVEFPWLPVLAFTELSPQADLFSLGTLGFAAETPPAAAPGSPSSAPPPADLSQP